MPVQGEPGARDPPVARILVCTRNRTEGIMMGKPLLTVRIARWSAEHPWRAIGAWLVFVAICIGAGQVAGTKQAEFDDNPTGELATYQSIVDEAGFQRPATENAGCTAQNGRHANT